MNGKFADGKKAGIHFLAGVALASLLLATIAELKEPGPSRAREELG